MISNNITSKWGFRHNYQNANNSRIWLLWDTCKLRVITIQAEAQLIHCHIEGIGTNGNCYIIVEYGYNTSDKKKELWTNLRDLAIGLTTPWIICGHSNALLYPEDRHHGNPVQPAKIVDFSNCLHDLSLNVLIWKGDYYTWTNKQKGSNRICSRIDRSLGNFDWMIQ